MIPRRVEVVDATGGLDDVRFTTRAPCLQARAGADDVNVSVTLSYQGCNDERHLATAAFLLGPREGLARLEREPGAEGALILEDGTIRATGGMRDMSDLSEADLESRLAAV